VHRLHYRLLWPPGRTLRFKNHNTSVEPVVTPSADFIEHTWELRDTPAVLPEDRLPAWFDPYPWIQLSEFDSWSAVAKWADGIYTEVWAGSPELEAVAEQIKSKHESQANHFSAAVRFVQDEIRYLGLEIGPNSLKPHPADFVLSRRFGDCKDKSVLLCSILRKLGIDAHPALVHSTWGRRLDEWHPSPYAFDHVVVRAIVEGKERWVDPAIAFQRGPLEKIFFPDYGRALIVRPDSTELVNVRPSGHPETRTSVVETYTSKDFKEPVTLEVTTVYSGDDADEMRSYFRNSSPSEVEKRYVNYYASDYPDMELGDKLKIEDNEAKNEITVTERYTIKNFWSVPENDRNYYANFYTHDIESFIRKPSTTRRAMPLGIDHPKHFTQTIRAALPGEWSIDDDEAVIEDDAIRFSFKSRYAKKTLTLDYSYQTRGDHIPALKVKEHLANIDRIWGKMNYQLFYPVDSLPSETVLWWAFGIFTILAVALAGLIVALVYLLRKVKITIVR
jgi:hypothetical protein